MMAMISKLENDSYTKIPDIIVEKAGLKLGSEIIWYYDEKSKQILLMERPKNFAKALRGLGKETWQKVDANSYLQEERTSWE
jgi:hypothetical protein